MPAYAMALNASPIISLRAATAWALFAILRLNGRAQMLRYARNRHSSRPFRVSLGTPAPSSLAMVLEVSKANLSCWPIKSSPAHSATQRGFCPL